MVHVISNALLHRFHLRSQALGQRLGTPMLTAVPIHPHFPTRSFSTQTSKRAVCQTGGGPNYIKCSAGQCVCNYLFQLSVKEGIFFEPGRNLGSFPSCEILLTKVLARRAGQRGLLGPVPSSP